MGNKHKHFIRWLAFGTLIGLILSACQSTPALQPAAAAQPSLPLTLVPATSTPAATATPWPTATATESLGLTQTPSPSPTPMGSTPAWPSSHYITAISGHKQVYNLGCEAGAAVDWAHYFGTDFYEYTFQVALPISDNPDFGYVGDVFSEWGQIPPYAYGVHAGPVAELLSEFGVPALAVKGLTVEEVYQNLAEDKPIIVWVIGNMEYSEPVLYTDTQGRTATVAPYQHVVILTGYDEDSLRYMNNGKFYDEPVDVFLTSWGVLGNMAVIHE